MHLFSILLVCLCQYSGTAYKYQVCILIFFLISYFFHHVLKDALILKLHLLRKFVLLQPTHMFSLLFNHVIFCFESKIIRNFTIMHFLKICVNKKRRWRTISCIYNLIEYYSQVSLALFLMIWWKKIYNFDTCTFFFCQT